MTADSPPLPSACAAWLAEVDRVMKRDWCIDSEDAGWSVEDVLRYSSYGETPAAFVEWFAEKYGLISKNRWNPFGILSPPNRP